MGEIQGMGEWGHGGMGAWGNGGMMEWGMLECWNDGIGECWNDGMVEWWNVGMGEWWNGECWNIGMMEWGMVWRGNRESGNLELKKKDAELVGGGAAEEDAPKDLLAGTFRSCRTRRQGATGEWRVRRFVLTFFPRYGKVAARFSMAWKNLFHSMEKMSRHFPHDGKKVSTVWKNPTP
jgi:hypothetical protein